MLGSLWVPNLPSSIIYFSKLIVIIFFSGTLYNDNFKQCSATSNTCKLLEAGGDNGCIIDSCANRQDGVYQLCTTCRWYARCKNGNLVKMPCPAEMLWDDARKYCVHTKHCVLSEWWTNDFAFVFIEVDFTGW